MMRLTDREFAALMDGQDVRLAMLLRCEEQGHDYENCCSTFLRIYQKCKWCKR